MIKELGPAANKLFYMEVMSFLQSSGEQTSICENNCSPVRPGQLNGNGTEMSTFDEMPLSKQIKVLASLAENPTWDKEQMAAFLAIVIDIEGSLEVEDYHRKPDIEEFKYYWSDASCEAAIELDIFQEPFLEYICQNSFLSNAIIQFIATPTLQKHNIQTSRLMDNPKDEKQPQLENMATYICESIHVDPNEFNLKITSKCLQSWITKFEENYNHDTEYPALMDIENVRWLVAFTLHLDEDKLQSKNKKNKKSPIKERIYQCLPTEILTKEVPEAMKETVGISEFDVYYGSVENLEDELARHCSEATGEEYNYRIFSAHENDNEPAKEPVNKSKSCV